MLLENKVAVVTGVGPGMGRSIVHLFAREGASLALGARNAERLQTIAREAEAVGRPVIAMPTDHTDRDSGRRLVHAAVDRFGGIDILVQNGADIGDFVAAADADPDRWREIMEANFFGALHLVQAVVPSMKQRGEGRIIFINSGAGIDPAPLFGGYGASKAALASLVRSLATELGPFGIRANGVHLGPVNEDHYQRWAEDEARKAGTSVEQWTKQFVTIFPLRYVPPPDECAGTVLFLASDLSRPITGQAICVNAGRFGT
ncbi:MAG: short-chain dehydrogenase/reductase [Deltaproteobacteria bacterium]|nr:short-chain dehydrogenase/reductase [Deltaproteobacteria bacterium]